MTDLENFADAWDAGFRALLLNQYGDASHPRIRNPFIPGRPCPCGEKHEPTEQEKP